MKKTRYVYVTSFGGLWRLTRQRYRRFLQDVASGKMWDLDHYGVQLADDVHNVTDMNQVDATYELGRLPTRD